LKKGEIKYLLQNKKYIAAEIIDLEYQIQELLSLESVSIAGISYDERTQSTNKISNFTECQALENVAKVQKLQRDKIKLETQIKRLEKGMEALTDLERRVLTMKYVDNNKWTYINIKLKNENVYLRHIADRAINTLNKIMK
jgi:cell division protein FtsB